MAKILGIDLGTTNSAMAIVEAGVPRVIENSEGARTTPSVVAIGKSGERLTGVTAKRQAVANARNTIYSIKRLMGRRFKDKEVQHDKTWLPYEIREAANGGVEVKMADKWYKPEEISAMILQKLKTDAESRLGEKITDAVITVPAYFDDSQRQATKTAGEIAGFNVRRIINEPTAAALAYGLDKKKAEQIVVYDFGGGTFDISVLEIGDEVVEVKATGGDTHLGGDDIDQRIISFIVAEFKKQEGIDLSKDILAMQRLKEAGERAKQELSSVLETEINLPFITSTSEGPKHLLLKLTRAKLEEIVADFIDKSIKLTEQTIKETGLKISDIDEIVLVGGQTRMPKIQELVKKLLGKEAHKDINPDEVVAVGAAVQAGIFQGDVKDVLLLDVTPLTLSIETLGGVSTPMITKNTTVPTAKTEVFSTAADNQTSVEIHVLQGERAMAKDNKTLARFILDGIPPAARGLPKIEVTFDIDANGILTVTAIDKATNKKQTVRIEASTGLTKEEIEKMKREADTAAAEDQKLKELVEIKNLAENTIYNARKILQENKDKIPQAIADEVEGKIKDLEKEKDTADINRVRTLVDELSRSLSKIGQAMYGQTTPPPGTGPTDNQNPDDDIKDTEYRET